MEIYTDSFLYDIFSYKKVIYLGRESSIKALYLSKTNTFCENAAKTTLERSRMMKAGQIV